MLEPDDSLSSCLFTPHRSPFLLSPVLSLTLFSFLSRRSLSPLILCSPPPVSLAFFLSYILPFMPTYFEKAPRVYGKANARRRYGS